MQDDVEIFEATEARDSRLQRLYRYWREKCADRPFPNRADIDPIEFSYILGFVTMVDIITPDQPAADGPSAVAAMPAPNHVTRQRYYFRLDGSRLAEISGADYTGRYLDELPWPDYIDFIRWTYDEVQRKKRPLGYRRQGNIDEHTFDEETIILPLGSGRGVIDKLIVAVIPGEVDPADTHIVL